MKGYIQTIDSLNTENINLTNSLNKTNKELSQVQSENKNIKDDFFNADLNLILNFFMAGC